MLGRADVGAAFRLAVARHVFQRREHMVFADGQRVALKSAHRGDTELADEIRILAVRFLDAPPARIAPNVDNGRKHQLRAARANLPCDDGEHAGEQLRIPRAGQPDGLRKCAAPRAANP